MNTKYGRMEGNGIAYAPDTLEAEGGVKLNPSAASYLAAGWKRIVDEPPRPEDGCRVEPSGWTEGEAAITRTYKQVQGAAKPPAGPRVFSKLKLVAALKAADKWVLVKTWLEEKAYYDYYLAAQNFAEDNELFVEGKEAIKRYLGMSDEQIEAILSQCVAD